MSAVAKTKERIGVLPARTPGYRVRGRARGGREARGPELGAEQAWGGQVKSSGVCDSGALTGRWGDNAEGACGGEAEAELPGVLGERRASSAGALSPAPLFPPSQALNTHSHTPW